MDNIQQEQVIDTPRDEKEYFLEGPVPGMSLTNSPDNKLPFESAPEYTDYDTAVDYLFNNMLESGPGLVQFKSKGVPLEALTAQVAFFGFSKGKWNPDLMALLIEPILYIMIFLAEQAGVDYVLSQDEELEHASEDAIFEADGNLQRMAKQAAESAEAGDVPDALPEEVQSFFTQGLGE